MKNVNRKLRKDYFKQIVTFFLVCCMFCNPAVLAEVVLDSQEPGSGITVTPLGTGTTQSMTAGNGGIGYFSDFDIDLGHTVICDQGGAQNSALFKVTSLDGTQIYGTFTTNGKLYLQDIRGIMIGANGEINASKFVASTLNINNTDWQKFVNGEINQLKFERGAEDPTGIVDNQGLINAARVYLIGSQVLNSGTIKAGENASDLVVMAAGNKVFLTHEDSKVLIKVPTDLVTPDPATNKVDIDAASTINADQVVLAAGDIFTAALNVGSLAATANRDITLEGTITTTGDITLVAGDDVDAQVLDAGGSVDISASDNTINLHEDVSADVDILLNNNTVADAGITLDAVEDVVLAAGKNLEGDGTLTVQADDDIILGAGSNPGDVSAVGDLTLDAGHSIEVADGGSITAGDDVFILGLLKALGDLTIEATEGGIDATDVFMSTDGSLLSLAQNDSLNMELAFADVINSENTNLSATSTGGSVTSAKADTWRTIAASANTFINLNDSDTGTGGDITTKALTTTTGDILITSNFGNVRAQGNITSGDDVKITAKDEGPDGSGDAIFLEGEIGEVFVPVHVEAVGDIWLNNNTWAAGGVSLDAGQDVRVGWQGDQDPWDPTDGYYAPKTLKGGGALTIEADRDITLGGDVESVGNLVLWADKDNGGDPGGDMTALGNVTSTEGNIDIYASDSTIILTGDKVEASGDVTLHNNTELHGGNQRIDAVNGKLITVDGVNVDKSTAGNADFGGGSGIEFGGNVTGSGLTASDTITFEDAVTANGTGPAEDQRFDAGLGSLWAKGTITKNAGVDLTLGGDEGIDLDGTVDVQTAAGSLTIEDDFTAAADLIATENVTLEGAGTLDGFVNQKIEAEKGKLYANDSIHKIEDGRLDMIGGFDGPLGSGDYSVKTKDVTVDKGALYITGKANVLLDGDLYSSGRMELTSNADGDLGADVGLLQHTSGTINSGDDVDIAALNSRILLNGGVAYDPANAAATTYVSAGGDILLYSSTSIAPDRNLDAGDDVALAANKRLLSDGSLTIEAGEDILLGIHDVTNHWSNQGVGSGGDVRVNGDLTLTAGDEVYAHGKLTTLDGSEGSINIDASDPDYSWQSKIHLYDDVTADLTNGGDIILHANTKAEESLTLAAGHDVIVGEYTTDCAVHLYGGSDLTIDAGHDITAYGKVKANGTLIMDAEEDISVYRYISAGGYLDMEAVDITVGDFVEEIGGFVEGDDGIDIYASHDFMARCALESYEGYIDVEAGHDIYAGGYVYADESIDMLAGNDITLGKYVEAYDGHLFLTATEGSITVGGLERDSDEPVHKGGPLYASDGDMILNAGEDIIFKTAFVENGSMIMNAGRDILAGGMVIDDYYEGMPIYLDKGGRLEVTADSEFGETEMTLTAGRDISFKSAYIEHGDLTATAEQNITLRGDVTGNCDYDTVVESANGDVRLRAVNGDISIAEGYAILGGEFGFHPIASDYYMFEAHGGGVSIIADNGKIYSPGGDDDTLRNVYIEGTSSQLDDIGVELPGDKNKKAAIVIISKEDLKLGPESVLVANGCYLPLHAIDLDGITNFDEMNNYWDELYNEFGGVIEDLYDGFEDYLYGLDVDREDFSVYKELLGDYINSLDDRPAIGFLAEPLTAIGDIIRDEGEPIDVAVYLASKTGDVDVESQEVYVDSPGTMVVDAYDTVTLGDMTSEPAVQIPDSINGGPEGRIWEIDRLEVASRITEWLSQASVYGRLPYTYNPEIVEAFIGGDYVLRGAGLGNPAIIDGRAWVLEDPLDPAPLYREAGQESEDEEFAEGGCTALMNWLATEVGVPADDIQVVVTDALALNTDIQPCEMCARLKGASKTLEDAEGTQIAALAQVVNEFVTTPAPPSPEQMTQIASALAEHAGDGTYYAAAGKWIDALVAYVGIMNTEMGYSASDAAAFAQKYLAPVRETGNAALTAYVEARLAALGG